MLDARADDPLPHRALALVALVAFIALVALAACTVPATSVLVVLDTDAPTNRRAVVRVWVTRGRLMGDAASHYTWTRGGTDAGLSFPASFGIAPLDEAPRDGAGYLTIEAEFDSATAGGAADHVRRVVAFRFTPRQTTVVRVFLSVACGAATSGCTTVPASRCTVSQWCEDQGLTCGDDARCVPVQPSGMDAAVATDTGMDAAVDRSVCAPGLVECAGRCVRTTTDPLNCGVCGTRCGTGTTCAAGRCECVRDCTGRQCGSDGCTGTCGVCAAGRTCSPAGQCVCGATETVCGTNCCAAGQVCVSGACCNATFRTELPSVALSALRRHTDGTYYAAGRTGGAMWTAGDRALVVHLDACGRELARTSFAPPDSMRSVAATIVGGAPDSGVPSTFYVAGSQDHVTAMSGQDGFIGRLRSTPLSHVQSSALIGSPIIDEVWSGAQASDGMIWLGGVSRVGMMGTSTCPWMIKVDPTTNEACGWPAVATCDGTIYGVANGTDGRVYFGGTHGANAMLGSYAPSECAVRLPCACVPSPAPREFIPTGLTSGVVRAVVDSSSTAMLVAGYGNTAAGNGAAFVALVPTGAAAVTTTTWNPTPLFDGFVAIARSRSGAPTVYAAGARNWDGAASTTTAPGVLVAFDAATLAQRWDVTLTGSGACWGVSTDEAGGVVVACAGPSGSSVRRCLSSGACP